MAPERVGFMELVRSLGPEKFVEWVEDRIGRSRFNHRAGAHSPGQVYKNLLGVRLRAYQSWETIPGFPVPDPTRQPMPMGGSPVRLYTNEQVVEIAYWHWKREVQYDDGDLMLSSQVAHQLQMEVAEVKQLMGCGAIPRDEEKLIKVIPSRRFYQWLHGVIRAQKEVV